MKEGVIPPLCSLLNCKDSQVIQVVMDGIHNMLKMATEPGSVDALASLIEECGGLDKIEALQNHENPEIYKLAYEIIEQYFNDEVWVDLDFCLAHTKAVFCVFRLRKTRIWLPRLVTLVSTLIKIPACPTRALSFDAASPGRGEERWFPQRPPPLGLRLCRLNFVWDAATTQLFSNVNYQLSFS